MLPTSVTVTCAPPVATVQPLSVKNFCNATLFVGSVMVTVLPRTNAVPLFASICCGFGNRCVIFAIVAVGRHMAIATTAALNSLFILRFR